MQFAKEQIEKIKELNRMNTKNFGIAIAITIALALGIMALMPIASVTTDTFLVQSAIDTTGLTPHSLTIAK